MGTLYKRVATGNYYAEFTDAIGHRVRRSTGTTSKQDARTIMLKWENDANNERHGVVATGATTVETLLLEYLDSLGNACDKYRNGCEQKLRSIFEFCNWIKVGQINQHEVESCIRQLTYQRTPKSPVKKLGLRSQGHYLGAAKSFTRWLTNVRRALPRDPLIATRKPNFAADRELVRRFLLPEEWTWLAKTDNALIYETAIQTGFRSNEIRNLLPEHVGENCVSLPAKFTKNKRPARQFITDSLRDRLRTSLPFWAPDGRFVDLLKRDLKTARSLAVASNPELSPCFLSRTNVLGHVLDFHALRHTCGAWLAISGVNIKVIQKVMRHSSITLTLDTYGHLLPEAEQDAVRHFDRLLNGSGFVPNISHSGAQSGHLANHSDQAKPSKTKRKPR